MNLHTSALPSVSVETIVAGLDTSSLLKIMPGRAGRTCRRGIPDLTGGAWRMASCHKRKFDCYFHEKYHACCHYFLIISALMQIKSSVLNKIIARSFVPRISDVFVTRVLRVIFRLNFVRSTNQRLDSRVPSNAFPWNMAHVWSVVIQSENARSSLRWFECCFHEILNVTNGQIASPTDCGPKYIVRINAKATIVDFLRTRPFFNPSSNFLAATALWSHSFFSISNNWFFQHGNGKDIGTNRW